jgi:hypothetical protein
MEGLLQSVNRKDIVASSKPTNNQIGTLAAPRINWPWVPRANDSDAHDGSTILPAAMYNQSIGLRTAYV